jgi:Cu/Ag efflux pump CusA
MPLSAWVRLQFPHYLLIGGGLLALLAIAAYLVPRARSSRRWRRSAVLAGVAAGLAASAGVVLLLVEPLRGRQPLPAVAVTAEVSGASAEDMERLFVIPVEKAVDGLPGLRNVYARCSFGAAWVELQFDPETDYQAARREIADRLKAARLPASVTPSLWPAPGYAPVILRYTLHAPKKGGWPAYALADLTRLQDRVIKPGLQVVTGVAAVTTAGGAQYAYEVLPDPNRLRRFGITLRQFQAALAKVKSVGADPLRNALLTRTPEAAASRVQAAFDQQLQAIRQQVVTTINGVSVRVDDLVEGGPALDKTGKLREAAEDRQRAGGVFVQQWPAAGWVSCSRLQRDAQGRPVRGPGGESLWDLEDYTVGGTVLALPGADAEATRDAVLARVKQFNETPGQLLPGVRIDVFPGPSAAPEDLTLELVAPLVASQERVRRIADEIRNLLRACPEVQGELTLGGVAEEGPVRRVNHGASLLVSLKPYGEWPVPAGKTRPRGLRELRAEIGRKLDEQVPGMQWHFARAGTAGAEEPFLPEEEGGALVKIFGPELEPLGRLGQQFAEKLKGVPGVEAVRLRSLGEASGIDLRQKADPKKCARLGLDPAAVQEVLDLMAYWHRPVGHVAEGEHRVELVIRWMNDRGRGLWVGPRDPLPFLAAPGANPPAVQPALTVADVTSPAKKDGEAGAGTFFVDCIYREGGRRFVAVAFRVRGRDAAAVLADAQARTAPLVQAPYEATWHGP